MITLICILTAVMLFAYWANYVMGNPLTDNPRDIDVGAIGHPIPNELALRRLQRLDRHCNTDVVGRLMQGHVEELNVTSEPLTRHGLRQDFKRELLVTARKLFTWERAILCPVCLHWWLTVIIVASLFIINFMTLDQLPLAGLTYLVNHLLIRKF